MKIFTTKNGYKIIRVLSGRSNVFLLAVKGKNILIDTSPGFMWKRLQKRLEKLNVDKIDFLILTHTHFDHAANAEKIKTKYRARVIVHKSESGLLANGDNNIIQGTNLFAKIIASLISKSFRSISGYEPCLADITTDSVFYLQDYGINCYIIHTPGHTPGSMSVVIDDEIAVTGDTMFGVVPWSVFPPFAADTTQLVNSWRKLLETNASTFHPSHGFAISRALLEKEHKRRSAV